MSDEARLISDEARLISDEAKINFSFLSYLNHPGLCSLDLSQANKVFIALHPEVDLLVVPEIEK